MREMHATLPSKCNDQVGEGRILAPYECVPSVARYSFSTITFLRRKASALNFLQLSMWTERDVEV